MQLVEQISEIVEAVPVAPGLAQAHGRVLGQGAFVECIECSGGHVREPGVAAETLPRPFADALEVSGGEGLNGQRSVDQRVLAFEVVVAQFSSRGVELGCEHAHRFERSE